MNMNHVLEQIRRKRYDLAETEILKEVGNWYIHSLIYRLQDKYEEERALLNAVRPSEIGNPYFNERLQWHDLTMREKCEGRPSLRLPIDPARGPLQSTVDKLCFVSAGDSRYFDLLVELLESLKATRIYKDTPINVIDCGLSEGEKRYLSGNFQVREIKPPTWDLPVRLGEIPAELEAMAVRAFLPMNFPGYEYYFWIDADAWIQDERSLASFIYNAETVGLGISCSSPAAAGKSYYTQITERETLQFMDPAYHDFDLFRRSGGVSVGAFCIKSGSPIDALWREVMARNTASRGFHFFSDTDSCSIAALLENIPVLSFEHHCHNSFQLENGILFYRDSPVGIVALPSSLKWQRYDKVVESVNTGKSMGLLEQVNSMDRDALLSIKRSLLAYRTLPWRDKPALEAMLCESLASSID